MPTETQSVWQVASAIQLASTRSVQEGLLLDKSIDMCRSVLERSPRTHPISGYFGYSELVLAFFAYNLVASVA